MQGRRPSERPGVSRFELWGWVFGAGALGAGAALAFGGCVGDSSSPPESRVPRVEDSFTSSECVAPPRPSAAIALSPVFSNFEFQRPIALVQARRQGDEPSGRWFLIDQHGLVHSFYSDGDAAIEIETSDLTDRVEVSERLDERGLLGIALHPDYPRDPRVFVNYTARDGALVSRVSSFVAGSGVLDLDSEIVLLQVEQPYTNHNGGHVAFGPDGYLYTGFGDGGDGGDPHGHGQNSNTWLGSMLRIDVDSDRDDAAYGIPADNPYVAGGGLPEIYAIGLRNPWRFSFDRQTGELWAGDVGQNAWEEISVIEKGGNYGWKVFEGFECYPPGSDCEPEGYTPPVHAYSNPGGDARRSVTGGYVYRGALLPELVGKYLFADYVTGEIWRLERTGDAKYGRGSAQVELLLQSGINVSSFAEDQAGELYVLDLGGGRVLRVGPGDGAGNVLPRLLTDTGCVAQDAPERLASNVVPYDVALPFWSDGVSKERYIVLPEGEHVEVLADGDVEVPRGTVLIKNFRHEGKLFETRFYVRHQDGEYSGYSYAWAADGKNAELVEETRSERVGDLDWVFPGRGACNQCHTAAAGRTLGLELRQLALSEDAQAEGGASREDQLSRLHSAGVFEERPSAVEPFPSVEGDASPELRARAYLHVNCSSCHRPDGPGRGILDLRHDVALEDTGLCTTAELGALGTPSGALIEPGNAAASVVHVRLSTRGEAQMPPLASNLVDEAGAALIEEWIESLDACP